MTMKTYDDFLFAARQACLDALDAFIEGEEGKPRSGWLDTDLPNLFHALDNHATVLWNRHVVANSNEKTR